MALQGKIAVVTGGGRGIGAAASRLLAARGASVVVNYMQNASAAENVVAEIRAAGGKAHAVQADVLDVQQIAHLITATLETYGRIDILVNNAACMRPSLRLLPLLQMKSEEFIQPITAELKAAFELTKAVAPLMVEQRYGRLIYIASIRAKHPSPGGITLGTAKAGVIAFTKYVAQELGPYGITANAIAPGVTATDAITSLPVEHKQHVLSMTPLHHIAQPDEIAGVIVFLASDDSSFMTGTCVPVNGGIEME